MTREKGRICTRGRQRGITDQGESGLDREGRKIGLRENRNETGRAGRL